MIHVADRLQADMDRTGSIACVGLDPRPALIPPTLRHTMLERFGDTNEGVAAAFLELNACLIEAIAGHCAAVKPQAACYEAYGAPGWQALVDTVRLAQNAGIAVIVDAKRGDIGSTSTQYAEAFFGGAPGLWDDGRPVAPAMATDWLTVNPYLGSDNVLEFVDDAPGRTGIFVLAKTSNPSSGELQDRTCIGPDAPDGEAVADVVARLIRRWGEGRTGACGLTDVGAVVGATYPHEARRLRALMPDSLFLVPGYGAQGGAAADAVAGARADGRGVLVSSSRAITGAWLEHPDDEDWAGASRAALDAMNADLASARAEVILDQIDLTGRPVQTMAEDERSPMGRHGVLGIQVSGRPIDGVDQTVVQVLLDDDRPDFDRTLLDAPMVAELTAADGRTLAEEPFDHDEFRHRLRAERDAGESVLRGVLVLTDGELPPPWVRLAFLPVAIDATAGATLVIRRTTVTELLAALDDGYAVGEVTDHERQVITMTIDQRHPHAT